MSNSGSHKIWRKKPMTNQEASSEARPIREKHFLPWWTKELTYG